MSLFSRVQRSKYYGCAVVFLLFALFEAAEAQSGRRSIKPITAPIPTVPAVTAGENVTAETAKSPAPGELPSTVKLLIGRQPTSRHLQTEDVILASFVKRLNERHNVSIVSIGDIKQAAAVARAKTETAALVLLKFDIDGYQSGTIILNSQDLEIEYFVYAPRTGKRQTKSKIYFQSIGGGRMRKSDWPNGTPIKVTPEAAGIEIADSLYQWLLLTAAQK